MINSAVTQIIGILLGVMVSLSATAELTIVAAEWGVFEQPDDTENEDVAWPQRTEKVRPATRVEAKLGVKFGVRYSVVGKTEAGARVKLIYLTPGVVDPDGKRHDKYEVEETLRPQKASHVMAFQFTEAHELVAGRWQFMVFEEDRLLLQKVFNVVGRE